MCFFVFLLREMKLQQQQQQISAFLQPSASAMMQATSCCKTLSTYHLMLYNRNSDKIGSEMNTVKATRMVVVLLFITMMEKQSDAIHCDALAITLIVEFIKTDFFRVHSLLSLPVTSRLLVYRFTPISVEGKIECLLG